jgi:hypothetical protein
MLKHAKDITDKDRQEALNRLNEFLDQSKPRKASKELKKFCTPFIFKVGIWLTIVGVVMFLIVVLLPIIIQSVEPPGHSFVKPNPSQFPLFIMQYALLIVGLIEVFVSLIIKQKRLNILKFGQLHEAKITKIKKFQDTTVGVKIFKIDLEIHNENRCTNCHSYVRAEFIDHFYDIMNSESDNLVDVIYNGNKEVILPLNIIYMSRLPKFSPLC